MLAQILGIIRPKELGIIAWGLPCFSPSQSPLKDKANILSLNYLKKFKSSTMSISSYGLVLLSSDICVMLQLMLNSSHYLQLYLYNVKQPFQIMFLIIFIQDSLSILLYDIWGNKPPIIEICTLQHIFSSPFNWEVVNLRVKGRGTVS